MSENQQLAPLEIFEVGERVLRQTARALTIEEILSDPIQSLIRKMQDKMRQAPGVGLAASQIGLPLQIAVVEDLAVYHNRWTPEQLKERERCEVPFHVIINPMIHLEEKEEVEFFEGCLSVPNLVGIVPRAIAIRVECLNEKAQPVVIKARGWYARILQHEIDHMKGILFLDKAHSRTLMTSKNFINLWKDKPVPEVAKILCCCVSCN